MNPTRISRRRLAWRSSLAAMTIACAFGAGPALAVVGPRDGGTLSPGLTTLAKPSVRSLPPARQAAILGVPAEGPGSLVREGGRVLVDVRFEHGAIARLRDLEAAGADVVSSSRRYQTVTAAAAPAALREVAAVPGVVSVAQSRAPIVYDTPSTSLSGESSCEGGSVVSEGLGQLRVDEARELFGLRGKGITVGVLSDSFNTASEAADGSGPIATHAHEDIESNDLPGPAGTCSGQQAAVDVLEDEPSAQQGAADEGRAMLQIVHDLAPHASLAFATAFKSEVSFAQNIERLARPVSEGGAGAQVIVDDVAYFEEPFFQDGPVAAAIDKVTAEGVTYLSAAGNDNLFDAEGNEIASWQAPAFRDSHQCPQAIEGLEGFNGSHCMDFDPGPAPAETDSTFGITVAAHATLTVDLQWDEPWFGVASDLDAFLLSAGGQIIAASFEGNTGKKGTQKPVEIVQWENKSSSPANVNLAINRFSGASPLLKFILLENGGGVTKTEYPKSAGGDVVGPTIFGHAGAPGAIALAAVRYDESSAPESFSSRGPVTHFFEPVNGISPAGALLSPETIAKPDVAATDCGATTFFAHRYNGVTWRFCGTSAAAPHAAAVAALLRQANPLASEQQIRASLTETATAVGSFPASAVGSGLIDAHAAVESLPEPFSGEDGPSTVVAPLEGKSAPTAGPTPPAVVKPPRAFFLRHPPGIVLTVHRTARVLFRFGSDQPGVTFLCRVDSGRFHVCGARLSRSFSPGRHVVRVKARDQAGSVGSAVVFGFRVRRVG